MHTSLALVTGVQTCSLPICGRSSIPISQPRAGWAPAWVYRRFGHICSLPAVTSLSRARPVMDRHSIYCFPRVMQKLVTIFGSKWIDGLTRAVRQGTRSIGMYQPFRHGSPSSIIVSLRREKMVVDEQDIRTGRQAVGIFHSSQQLQDAIDELLSSGFHRAVLSLLASESAVARALGTRHRQVGGLGEAPAVQRSAERNEVGRGQGGSRRVAKWRYR